MLIRPEPGAKGVVNLPYHPPQGDAFGNQWYIYQGGTLRQQGNMPVYGEGASLLVNNNQASMNTNQARLEDNGELVLENMTVPGATVTRRLMFYKNEGYVRVIDIFKNPGGQELMLPVMYRSQMPYGLTASQTIADPQKAGRWESSPPTGKGAASWRCSRGVDRRSPRRSARRPIVALCRHRST